MYVQYGCGWCAPAQWVNFDASPTLRFERLPVLGRLYSRNERRFPPGVRHADVAMGLPVASGTCDGVYCSHVLEHLSLEDFDRALAETLRILKPGGIFRLVVPDLETAARDYLADLERGCARANTRFLQATHLGAERRPAGLGAFLRDWLGNSRHLWMGTIRRSQRSSRSTASPACAAPGSATARTRRSGRSKSAAASRRPARSRPCGRADRAWGEAPPQ